MRQVADAEPTGASYAGLYRLGGVAAVLVAALTLGEVIGFALYPQPATVSDWFMLFQRNPLVGLLDFWALEVPMYIMFVIVFTALYMALRGAGQSLMAIALPLALVGCATFFATNNPFAMLSLSNQHAAATTDAQRAALLAAGQAVLTMTGQRAVGGFNMGLLLVSVAGLIASAVMLRSHIFSRSTAWVGLLAHALSLADYVRQALTSSPVAALLVILPNALLLMVWYVMVGRRLYLLGRAGES
jgi:hypothetical protein